MPAGPAGLTESDVASFAKDGYLVLPRAVGPRLVERARAYLDTAAVDPSVGLRVRPDLFLGSARDPALVDLLCESSVLPSVQFLIGEGVDLLVGTKPPRECAASLALVYQSTMPAVGSVAGAKVGLSGYQAEQVPFWGWQPHLDGVWSGGSAPPAIGEPVSEQSDWYRPVGTNGCPMVVARNKRDEVTSTIAHFTLLIGIAISDQPDEGMGQLGVLPGAHRSLAAVFREQRAAGGPLGTSAKQVNVNCIRSC